MRMEKNKKMEEKEKTNTLKSVINESFLKLIEQYLNKNIHCRLF